jgi:hypothetical protein
VLALGPEEMGSVFCGTAEMVVGTEFEYNKFPKSSVLDLLGSFMLGMIV